MLLFLALLGGAGVLFIFYHYGRDLPDYRQLADYEPPTVTRLHAGDGRLLVEYATENRVYVPVKAIPRRVVNAFLSAEDKNFYSHPGVDFLSVARAIVTNMINLGQDRRLVGASTITQQVAKNFLLTNEVSMTRKVKEAILAFRIENAFDKDRILDLYLNEIYLGFGSYGVAAAALNYFNKSLDELSVAEAAYMAALPKAPNNYHPIRRAAAALARRDWVIGRMLEDGRISFAEAEEAWAQPLRVYRVDPTEIVKADYFVEEVRRELAQIYGETRLYEGGLSVRTTLDPRLQRIAERVLREGLIAYDRRHGWRGPVAKRDLEAGDWRALLAAVEPPKGSAPWTLAMVLGLDAERAEIGLSDGTTGHVPMAELTWARPWLKGQKVGAKPKKPAAVLQAGDVVMVERIEPGALKPLAEVRSRAVAAWAAAERLEAIEAQGLALAARLGQDASIWDLAEELGVAAMPLEPFTRMTPPAALPGALIEPVFSAAAAAGASAPSNDGAGVVVAQVSSIATLDPEAMAAASATIERALEQSLTKDMAEYFARAVVARHDARIEPGVIEDVFRRLGATGQPPY